MGKEQKSPYNSHVEKGKVIYFPFVKTAFLDLRNFLEKNLEVIDKEINNILEEKEHNYQRKL